MGFFTDSRTKSVRLMDLLEADRFLNNHSSTVRELMNRLNILHKTNMDDLKYCFLCDYLYDRLKENPKLMLNKYIVRDNQDSCAVGTTPTEQEEDDMRAFGIIHYDKEFYYHSKEYGDIYLITWWVLAEPTDETDAKGLRIFKTPDNRSYVVHRQSSIENFLGGLEFHRPDI